MPQWSWYREKRRDNLRGAAGAAVGCSGNPVQEIEAADVCRWFGQPKYCGGTIADWWNIVQVRVEECGMDDSLDIINLYI